jgi:hypothetical protein
MKIWVKKCGVITQGHARALDSNTGFMGHMAVLKGSNLKTG